MDRIIRIQERSLTPESMDSMDTTLKVPLDPLAHRDEPARAEAVVSAEHAHHALQYYATSPKDRDSILYKKGCSVITKIVVDMYDSLMLDEAWSDRSKDLFEAVNCGNIVSAKKATGGSKLSDLAKRGTELKLSASDVVIVEIRANAKLYWDRERELYAESQRAAVRYTAADPGPFLEYERRFHDASESDSLGLVDVVVRKLVDGDAASETVRAVQKFVLESTDQYNMIQALYELCVWHFAVQTDVVDAWRSATNRKKFSADWAQIFNKKIALVRVLSKVIMSSLPASTVSDIQPAKPKKTSAVSKFQRYCTEQRKCGTKLNRTELRVNFDALSTDGKAAVGVASRTPPPALKVCKPPDVVIPAEPDEPEAPMSQVEKVADESDDDDDDDFDVDDPDKNLDDDDDQSDGVGDDCSPPREVAVAPVKPKPKVKPPKKNAAPKAPQVSKTPQVPQATKVSEPVQEVKVTDPVRAIAEVLVKEPKKKRKAETAVAKPLKVQKVMSKEVVHELLDNGKAMFLWELFSHNMAGMVEARKPFTSFEETPFEAAYEAYTNCEDGGSVNAKFIAAKKALRGSPGISHCFQMFNLMFKREPTLEPEDEDDFLFG